MSTPSDGSDSCSSVHVGHIKAIHISCPTCYAHLLFGSLQFFQPNQCMQLCLFAVRTFVRNATAPPTGKNHYTTCSCSSRVTGAS